MERSILLNLLTKLENITPNSPIWIAGGPVRDLALKRPFTDIDLVVPDKAIEIAQCFAQKHGGTFLTLHEKEGVARVVFPEAVLDFSQFRGNAKTIDEDLRLRDFTINSLALDYSDFKQLLEKNISGKKVLQSHRIIDPTNGISDIKNKKIRSIAIANLKNDPLRLIRAYRFMAELGFEIEQETQNWIKSLASLILKPAPERIDHELNLIMATDSSYPAFSAMVESNLLFELFPEIQQMSGVDQPGFHHLDVFEHSLEALRCLEKLIANPEIKFKKADNIKKWIAKNKEKIPALKWAAFFHDIGKPVCKGQKGDRVTFYEHDTAGAEIVEEIGNRLRWPKKRIEFTTLLIRLHMRPFHLLNDLRKNGPTKRAMRRLLKKIGSDYPALFLLAMADSMAGKGPLKPVELDDELSALWEKVDNFHHVKLKPIQTKPKLLTGKDLQKIFKIPQGPFIGKLLESIEEAQVEGKINSREEAIEYISSIVNNSPSIKQ